MAEPIPTQGIPNSSAPTSLIVTIIALTILATIIVILRIYTRVFVSRACGLDDYLMIAASIFSIAASSFCGVAIHYGFGRSIATFGDDPKRLVQALKYSFASEPTNITAFYFSKISVAFFLIRLVPTSKWTYSIWAINALLTINVIYGYVNLFAECTPFPRVWDRSIPGSCWNPTVVLISPYLSAVVGIIVDGVFVLLPIILLWTITINIRTKIGILIILGLGTFTAGCSIVKLSAIPELSRSVDPTLGPVNLVKWSIIELNVGIMAASLPQLRPLFKFFNNKTQGSGGRTSQRKGYNPQEYDPSRSYGLKSPYRRDLEHSLNFNPSGQNKITVKSGVGDPYELMEDSQENILSPTLKNGNIGIVRTREVLVSTGKNSAEETESHHDEESGFDSSH